MHLTKVVDQRANQHTLLNLAVLDLRSFQMGQLLEDGFFVDELSGVMGGRDGAVLKQVGNGVHSGL